MITKFKLFENQEINLKDILSDPNFKTEDIEKYIGLDEKMYQIKTDYKWKPTYNLDGFSLQVKENKLEKLLKIENGFIGYLLRITSSYGSSDIDYCVDDSELNYIHNYLSGSTLKSIEQLAEIFDYNIDIEKEGDIKKFFEYLGLEGLLDDIKNEISMENERAIEDAAKVLLKSLPFNISCCYDANFEIELDFEYQEIINYIKKNNLDVKNIKEFVENVDTSDFGYDFEYEMKYDYLGNFEDVNRIVENTIDTYVSSPDYVFPKIIEIDNLELMKDKIELANFTYIYDVHIKWDRKRLNLFDIAKEYNGEILKWFKSYNFQKFIIDQSNVVIYNNLIESEIIDPQIEKEYKYLVEIDGYNL